MLMPIDAFAQLLVDTIWNSYKSMGKKNLSGVRDADGLTCAVDRTGCAEFFGLLEK